MKTSLIILSLSALGASAQIGNLPTLVQGGGSLSQMQLKTAIDGERYALQSLLQVIEDMPEQPSLDDIAILEDRIAELNKAMEQKARCSSDGEPASAAMVRAALPDMRSILVRINALRGKLGPHSAKLDTICFGIPTEADRLKHRDKIAKLVQDRFNVNKRIYELLHSAKDAESAKAAAEGVTEQEKLRNQLDAELGAQRGGYLTREDMLHIQTPFREGWEPLRLKILAERDRLNEANGFGDKGLQKILSTL